LILTKGSPCCPRSEPIITSICTKPKYVLTVRGSERRGHSGGHRGRSHRVAL